MSDLVVALALMMLLSAALFAVGVKVTRRLSALVCDGLAVSVVAGLIVYITMLWDKPLLVRLIPVASVIVWGNWFLPGAALLASVAWQRTPGGWLRKSLPVCLLFTTGTYATMAPLFGKPPECGDLWEGDVCLQTTRQTCTAACAATLLRHYGIKATEQEMAELCLTRDGTRWQGLYRGLKRKTVGTPWDVVVITADSADWLRGERRPLILRVGIQDEVQVDATYIDEYGWTPGVNHSVVLLGPAANQRVRIADPTPAICEETWTFEDLKILWRGHAVGLVRRHTTLAEH